MSTLYASLLLMLVSAITVLGIPFVKKNALRSFAILASIMALGSLGLYRVTSDTDALQQWFTNGKLHYQFLVNLKELGGIDGVINRIKQKLEDDPNDAQGWLILGKLYLSKQSYTEAKSAFEKAQALQPQDEKIHQLVKIATSQIEIK